MRRTYAPNSIVIGVLLGMLVYFKFDSMILGILAAIAISVVGWLAIRAIERAVAKGVDKASEAIINKYEDKKFKH